MILIKLRWFLLDVVELLALPAIWGLLYTLFAFLQKSGVNLIQYLFLSIENKGVIEPNTFYLRVLNEIWIIIRNLIGSVTGSVLHANTLHLVMNVFLYVFAGYFLKRMWSINQIVGLWAIANILTFFIVRMFFIKQDDTIIIGASAGIAALFVALVIEQMRRFIKWHWLYVLFLVLAFLIVIGSLNYFIQIIFIQNVDTATFNTQNLLHALGAWFGALYALYDVVFWRRLSN
jgi:membrane associated rhomboid family serine protease